MDRRSPRRSSQRFVPFSAGTGPVMLPVGSHRASTAICYEVVFPALARDAVAAGSELLTTVTNDGWYGRSSAPYQHFEMASMRAIEQGRYLARAANTGISGIVDPYGRTVVRGRVSLNRWVWSGRRASSPVAPCIR